MENQIKVVIVDDHQMFLDGMARILSDSPHIFLAGIFNDSTKVADMLSKEDVDVLISDIEMPEVNGRELSEIVKKVSPNTKIIITSMHDDIHYVTSLLKTGVAGYLTKKTGKEELINAIKAVGNGKTYYSDEIKETLVKSVTGQLENEKHHFDIKLTKREIEIIQLIALEYSSQEIGDKLFISLNTTETHRKNIMRKTNSKNMAGLIRYALKCGLID